TMTDDLRLILYIILSCFMTTKFHIPVYSSSLIGERRIDFFYSKKKGMKAMASVGVVMGSISDWETMKHTCDILNEVHIPYEKEVISAHRTPEDMLDYATSARDRGLKVIIAGAGGAAHLPGMVASQTTLPVIGVPVESKALKGLDSLLSIVQMPGGVPTATVAIGKAGAKNAGILAAQILATSDEKIAKEIQDYKEKLQDKVTEMREDLAQK